MNDLDEAEHNALLMDFLGAIRDQQLRGSPLRPENAPKIVFLWFSVLGLHAEARAFGGIITDERVAEIQGRVFEAIERGGADPRSVEVLGRDPEQRAFEAIEKLVNTGLLEVPGADGALLVSESGLENLSRFEAITPEIGLMLEAAQQEKTRGRS